MKYINRSKFLSLNFIYLIRKVIISFVITICLICSISNPAFSYRYELKDTNQNYIDYERYKLEDLISLKKLTQNYQEDFKDLKGSKEAEDAFIEIMIYYEEFVDVQNEKIIIGRLYAYRDADFTRDQYSLYPFGLIMWIDDGGSFLVESNKFIYENFAPYLSKEWQELLKFEQFFDKIITIDARYIIPKSKVKKIIFRI